MDLDPAIQVTGLSKRYDSREVVRGVTFDVDRGEVFAFLGPNGAGKTTTIKMLCTLAKPTSGVGRVAGCDVTDDSRGVRQRIGLVFQDPTLDRELTVAENLRFHGSLYSIPRGEVNGRIDSVLALVELEDRSHSLVSTLSGGMARRVEIARALLHSPEVLFLDEPTVGLDPQTRARIWQDLLRLRAKHNQTIFFTTHYLDEAEHADRIAIIDNGTIVACDSPAGLKAAVASDCIELVTDDDLSAASYLAAAGFSSQARSGGLRVDVVDGERQVAAVVGCVAVGVKQVRVRRPTLDDVFLHFTGRDIRDGEIESSLGSSVRRFQAMQRR